MTARTTLRELPFDDALRIAESGGAFVDLRPIRAYLEVHIPGSLGLLYEEGPGMASRTRDCVPLEVPLILIDLGAEDYEHAAASLRGKGFRVPGKVTDGINQWADARGVPASTEFSEGGNPPQGTVLDVGDPGALPADGAVEIPAERLWARAEELDTGRRIVIAAGYGVRAALAVGILERIEATQIFFWWSK